MDTNLSYTNSLASSRARVFDRKFINLLKTIIIIEDTNGRLRGKTMVVLSRGFENKMTHVNETQMLPTD